MPNVAGDDVLIALRKATRESLHTEVSVTGKPTGARSARILRVPVCDRDGKERDPQAPVRKLVLAEPAPSVRSMADRSHGGILALEAAVVGPGEKKKKKKSTKAVVTESLVGDGEGPQDNEGSFVQAGSSSDKCVPSVESQEKIQQAERRRKKKNDVESSGRHEGTVC